MPIEGPAQVTLATLDTQVKSLDRDYQEIKHSLIGLNTKVDTSIAALGTKFEAAISGLSSKLEQRSTTHWPTIFGGFSATFVVIMGIGAALYGPVQRDTTRLEMAVSAIMERGVFKSAYEADMNRVVDTTKGLRSALDITIQQQRYNADQDHLNKVIEEVRRETVTSVVAISKTEENMKNLEKRLDAISVRLAQEIRDTIARLAVERK